MRIPKNRDAEKASRIKKVSRITGVSERQVYRVLAGDQTNEEVLATYMDLLEKEKEAFEAARENHLLSAVKELIPFK